MGDLFFGNLAIGHFSGKWMASGTPLGHTDYEYVIGSALKCPQFKCIEGHTDISALYYIDYCKWSQTKLIKRKYY